MIDLKRAFDLTVSVALLVASAPVMGAVSIVVAATIGRPVLFRQRRPGFREQPFTLYKFRTMTEERSPDGELLPDGQRLTALGRLLRRTSLDELPTLYNVLRGDMSLVGPRPLLERYLRYYTERERLRHAVRPGLTGLAQVHGRNLVSWDERLQHDVSYVERQSLLLDLQILVRTALLVLRRQGVIEDPRSTMLNLDEERLPGGVPNPEAKRS